MLPAHTSSLRPRAYGLAGRPVSQPDAWGHHSHTQLLPLSLLSACLPACLLADPPLCLPALPACSPLHVSTHRAQRERLLAASTAQQQGDAEGEGQEKATYKGMNAYVDYKAGFRREGHTVGAEKGSGAHGPLRGNVFVRSTARCVCWCVLLAGRGCRRSVLQGGFVGVGKAGVRVGAWKSLACDPHGAVVWTERDGCTAHAVAHDACCCAPSCDPPGLTHKPAGLTTSPTYARTIRRRASARMGTPASLCTTEGTTRAAGSWTG